MTFYDNEVSKNNEGKDAAMIEICPEENKKQKFGANLKIIGVGGAGGNAVNSMIDESDLDLDAFLVANTDAQSLSVSPVLTKIQLGSKITKGLGAGSNPDVGRRAAEEELDTLLQKVEGADILFLTGGLGGGTGSGALPVIAQAAKELGILTVAIVTKPFLFEGKRRAHIADEAIKALKSAVDTLIIVPNQRLLEIADEKISMLDAFCLSDEILKQAIKGISDIITKSGHINVDFADVRTIMKDMGMAIMGTGVASGADRARIAAQKAISSPLLENVSIEGARGVLINITGSADLGLYEINDAASLVYSMVSEDANIILGSVIDPSMGDEVMITVIATGFEEPVRKQSEARPAPVQQVVQQQKLVQEYQQPERVSKSISDYLRSDSELRSSAIQAARKEAAPATQVPFNAIKIATKQEDSMLGYDENDLDTPTFLRKKNEQEHEQRFVASGNDEEVSAG